MESSDHLSFRLNERQIDYILKCMYLHKSIRDAEFIPDEECLSQHRILVGILQIIVPAKVKHKFISRLQTWQL